MEQTKSLAKWKTQASSTRRRHMSVSSSQPAMLQNSLASISAASCSQMLRSCLTNSSSEEASGCWCNRRLPLSWRCYPLSPSIIQRTHRVTCSLYVNHREKGLDSASAPMSRYSLVLLDVEHSYFSLGGPGTRASTVLGGVLGFLCVCHELRTVLLVWSGPGYGWTFLLCPYSIPSCFPHRGLLSLDFFGGLGWCVLDIPLPWLGRSIYMMVFLLLLSMRLFSIGV